MEQQEQLIFKATRKYHLLNLLDAVLPCHSLPHCAACMRVAADRLRRRGFLLPSFSITHAERRAAGRQRTTKPTTAAKHIRTIYLLTRPLQSSTKLLVLSRPAFPSVFNVN